MNLTTDSDQSVTWQQSRKLHLRCYTAWLEANPKPAMKQILTQSEDPNTVDLPIALRRGKRRSSAISPTKERRSTLFNDSHDRDNVPEATRQPITPSRRRSKKRVRFSDP